MVAYLRLISAYTSYQLERVPMEVLDFAYYHLLKDKTETEVRKELSKKGWKNIKDQDYIFKSIGAVIDANDLRRMD